MPVKNTLSLFLLICLLSFFTITCKKINVDHRTQQTTQQNEELPAVDLGDEVTSSVSGFITNETDSAVAGANVQFGALNTTTDSYGYFEIKNAVVHKNAAFVTVTTAGYFKGIRTFSVVEGQPGFCRIKLIPKTITGSVNSTLGGNITTSNGLSIDIPSNGIMNASTHTMYTGTVHASMFWIDPTSEDLGRIMPGDLRGVDSGNMIKALQTYGMAIVELNGDAGEPLQVAEGKKVAVRFPIPASISSDAPSNVPLWYLDETNGLWKEEGFVTKNGNYYTGEVAHFTPWNVDISIPNVVTVSCIISDSLGNPVANKDVTMTMASNQGVRYAHGVTNINGYVSGIVPVNSSLALLIKEFTCIVYTKYFSTTSSTQSLGAINLPRSNTIVISGRAIDCNANPITNGHVIFQRNYINYTFPITAGNFSFPVLVGTCNANNFSIKVVNADTQEESLGQVYINGNQDMHIPDITVCGQISTERYSNLTLDGESYILGPLSTNEVYATASANNYPIAPYVAGIGTHTSQLKLINGVYSVNNDKIFLTILNRHWPADLNEDILNDVALFKLLRGTGSELFLYPLNRNSYHMTISECGTNPGDYVTGTVSGTFYEPYPNSNLPDTLRPHTIIYNFRVYKM